MRTLDTWKQRLPLILFMLLLQIGMAASRYKTVDTMYPNLTLDDTPAAWAKHIGGSDPGGYLDIAVNIVEGRKFSRYCETCNPPGYVLTDYWGPGTPFGLAFGLAVTRALGITSMKGMYFYTVFCDFLAGFLLLATFWNFSRNLWASLVVAFLCGLCPPIQNFNYNFTMTASETIHALPIAAAFFFLSRAFLRFWREPGFSKWDFLLGGFALGLAGITRESNFQFVVFCVLAFMVIAFFRKRSKLMQMALACAVFFVGGYAPRFATIEWNKHRTGLDMVGRAGIGGDPASYFFYKYEPDGFSGSVGIYFGDYLDPVLGEKIRQAGLDGKNYGKWAYWEVLKAAVLNPIKAISFKARLVPVLFLGTDVWPKSTFSLVVAWSIMLYAFFFAYLAYMIFVRKGWPHEVTYLYFTFILLAFLAFIHAEFRYSFPAMMALKIVPGLLLAEYFASRGDKTALR